MDSENITIENVLEIFSDFLDQSNDFEVVETKKMGVLTILDGSESKDRSELSIERVRDAEDLARQLLWFEISGYFYAENKHTTDPWESDEAVQNHVMMHIGVLPVKRTVNNQKDLCRQSSDRLAVSLCRRIIVIMVLSRSHQVEIPLDPFSVIIPEI